ncbi:MAG: hypothetical protein JWM34_2710 [Ilumatobacteraceae bacterium]|nr:hypothetical protein [Ilumatobacteraceae bacterium]
MMVTCASLVFAGCSSSSKSAAPTTELPPLTYVTVVTTPPTTVPPTTTIDPVALELAKCEAYIPAGAFTGNKDALDIWNFIGQDATKLAAACQQAYQDNPTLVAGFAQALDATGITVAPPTTPSTTAATGVTGTATTISPVVTSTTTDGP